jgi:hypothetical protein
MRSRWPSALLAAAVTLAGCSGSSGSSQGFAAAGAVAYYTTAYGGSMSIALWSTAPSCMSGGTPTGGASVLLLVVPGNPTAAKSYTVTSGGGPPMPPIAEWEIPASSLYEDVYTYGTVDIESVSSSKVTGTYSINLVPTGDAKGGFTMGSSTGSFSAPICPTP